MKNSIWGILSQIVVCVLSLFSRRVMIDTIGVEGVGLNAFLTSVITMLSLAELGIGTAIVYHMYLPLANGDTVQIKQLMNFYKIVYRAIAAAILVLGLILLPFMPKMAGDTSYSKSYISLIFVLFYIQAVAFVGRSETVCYNAFRFGIQNFYRCAGNCGVKVHARACILPYSAYNKHSGRKCFSFKKS